MTLVDVCSECGTLFNEDDDHCRRCGADRVTSSEKRELRDLCYTHTGDGPEDDELAREIKPIFRPRWGEVQWYEVPKKERKKRKETEEGE